MQEEVKNGVRTFRSTVVYLNEKSPRAFLDFPEPEAPHQGRETCPRCGGHRGWNLRLNAYPMPAGREDTPENRHRFTHYQAACPNCNGWGHVPEVQAGHAHLWETVSWLDMVHTERCRECGLERQPDTSG